MSSPASATALSTVLFDRLNRSTVSYCHWKSNINLDKSLAGETDLDLLVARRDIPAFVGVIAELGFKALRPRGWGLYPAMEDYIGLDQESGRLLHLHVHYQVILGEANVKSYCIPVESILLEGEHKQLGVRVPAPEAELFVYLLRLAAKSSRVPSTKSATRILKRAPAKTNDGEQNELEYLRGRTDAAAFRKLVDRVGIANSSYDVFDAVLNGSPSERRAGLAELRRALRRFRRFRGASVWVQYYGKFLLDAASAASRNNKKAFVGGGITVAIVGCDGAGKSTLVEAMMKRMRWKARAKLYYLGSNTQSHTWRTRAAVLMSVPFRAIKKMFPSSYFAQVCGLTGRFLMENNAALDRLSRYRSGVRDAANGAVVIFERFPLKRVMDWPLDFEQEPVPGVAPEPSDVQKAAVLNPFIRRLAARIYRKYEQISLPRLMIYLDVPDAAIDERRAGVDDIARRTIQGKNDRMRRYYADEKSTVPIVRVDASEPPHVVLNEVMKHVWNKL